jgi:hypothetical protein
MLPKKKCAGFLPATAAQPFRHARVRLVQQARFGERLMAPSTATHTPHARSCAAIDAPGRHAGAGARTSKS